MPHRNPPDPGGPLRRITSTAVVITFALVMTACVLGVMAWKALDAKKATLANGRHYDNDYCFVIETRDGRSHRMREYLDTQRGFQCIFGDSGLSRAA